MNDHFAKGVFIAGTNTGCGKTMVSVKMITALASVGFEVCGFKPIASGSQLVAKEYRNEDAELLLAASSISIPYQVVNPYALPGEVSPHIAEKQQGILIEPSVVCQAYNKLKSKADFVVVEGAGGWRSPLSGSMTSIDLVRLLKLPVILVVNLELGCINHALLTCEAILSDQADLLGWVANGPLSKLEAEAEVCDALVERLPAPMLGAMPYAFDKNLDTNQFNQQMVEFFTTLIKSA